MVPPRRMSDQGQTASDRQPGIRRRRTAACDNYGRTKATPRQPGNIHVLDQWGIPWTAALAVSPMPRSSSLSLVSDSAQHVNFPGKKWGWTRSTTGLFLRNTTGQVWKRSCCYHCPFQAAKISRQGWAQRWREYPGLAARGLELEYRALALNPRMPMFGKLSAWSLARAHQLDESIGIAQHQLASARWALYEVRRSYNGPAPVMRSVHSLARGSRRQMALRWPPVAGSPSTSTVSAGCGCCQKASSRYEPSTCLLPRRSGLLTSSGRRSSPSGPCTAATRDRTTTVCRARRRARRRAPGCLALTGASPDLVSILSTCVAGRAGRRCPSTLVPAPSRSGKGTAPGPPPSKRPQDTDMPRGGGAGLGPGLPWAVRAGPRTGSTRPVARLAAAGAGRHIRAVAVRRCVRAPHASPSPSTRTP